MSYRDPTAALRAHRDQTAAELDAARHAAEKLPGLEKELAETERLLATMESRRGLPLVDDIRIASPCDASWEAMVGDDKVRHCGACRKDVHNLEAMTAGEVEALLREHGGEGTCMRLYRRADGTILTADCPVGAEGARQTRRRRLRVAAAAAVAALGSGLMAAATGADRGRVALDEPADAPPASMADVENVPTMGGVRVTRQPPTPTPTGGGGGVRGKHRAPAAGPAPTAEHRGYTMGTMVRVIRDDAPDRMDRVANGANQR